MFTVAFLFALMATSSARPNALTRRRCTPYHTTFGDSSASQIMPISPRDSYDISPSGLSLYLDKPAGTVTKTDEGRTNDKLSDGATVNSTFYMLYGKLSVEIEAPSIPGVVTAAILIADGRDEIDIELLGGTPTRWDSNIFAPAPKETEPLYGVFNTKERYPKSKTGTISETHTYTVEWTEDKITWGVDSDIVRVLEKKDTVRNGYTHFPSHECRVQIGIWDASAPIGTSHWAKGPIDWESIQERVTATVKSVKVEC